ncbi:MAG: LysM peptidoglycan-binding domain-containing protein, partial [Chloroflexota bacterium]|nr:LysM peptidoglycan-binding domain-containing protein [Chloroflexota bacterium]
AEKASQVGPHTTGIGTSIDRVSAMVEVTCFRCSRIVHIAPDAEHCSVCGEDLRHLIPPAYASKYFYDRAAQLASGNRVEAALAEVERGLDYRESSELHLLGAILAKRLGDFDLMRQQVAAIPLDDVLRQEAEWLLRSHQTRQRSLREAGKARQPGRQLATTAQDETLPFLVGDVSPSPTRQPRSSGAGRVWFGLLTLLVLVGSAWVLLGQGAPWTSWLGLNETPTEQAETGEITSNQGVPPPVGQPISPTLQTGPVLTPTVSITITPDIPNNLVQLAGTPEPLAANTPQTVVDAIDPQVFDLKSFLTQKERSDLVQLEVAATLQGERLNLRGFVQMDAERRDLISLAATAPGVGEVNALDLLVRLPPIYVVQEGDTLWDITIKLYGDPARMQALSDANRAILPSPEALRIGMELTVPPIQ